MTDDPTAAPGRLSSRSREVRELGRGGMGRVVEAFDRELERAVALKHSLDESDAARHRSEREIAITARPKHPSIVPVYDAARGRMASRST